MSVERIGNIPLIKNQPDISFKDTSSKNANLIPFSDYLSSAINKTNDAIIQSEKLNNDFAVGRTDNIHQVMIAAEKAEIALQFTLQIRNKLLDAYNEIMRMQI